MIKLATYIKLANLLDELECYDAAKLVDEYIGKKSDLQVEMEKEVKEEEENKDDEDAEEVEVSKKKKLVLKFD